MIEDGVQGDSQTVKISTVDDCLAEYKNDTLLMKIDTMGSEGKIIKGASYILATATPLVMMEYGTHSKYMADMIPFIHQMNGRYCTCQQKLDTKLKKSGIKNESLYKIHQLF